MAEGSSVAEWTAHRTHGKVPITGSRLEAEALKQPRAKQALFRLTVARGRPERPGRYVGAWKQKRL